MNSLSQHTRAFTTGASIGAGGTRAADIRKLRNVHSELDYLNSPPKAALSYTPAVADAIGRFQEDFGLKRDGLITPDGPTEQALNLAIAANRTGDRTAFDLARDSVAHLNRRLKNLKDGKPISGNGENNAEIGARDSFGQYLGNETDFALAFGRTKLNSEADFTATRQGDTIHIQGIVTHKWEDTYDFEKGQIGAAGAHRLEKEMGAKPFPMGAAWQQNFSGTVSIKNGVLSNPKITWTDK